MTWHVQAYLNFSSGHADLLPFCDIHCISTRTPELMLGMGKLENKNLDIYWSFKVRLALRLLGQAWNSNWRYRAVVISCVCFLPIPWLLWRLERPWEPGRVLSLWQHHGLLLISHCWFDHQHQRLMCKNKEVPWIVTFCLCTSLHRALKCNIDLGGTGHNWHFHPLN